ncbi:MAG: SMC-Scp complex subunit ScpB [Candidatus Woesearchaeota archaeon]
MAATNDLKNRVEAILYASGKGVSAENLAVYTGETKRKVNNALKQLYEDYENRECSLIVREYNGKWKITVRGKYSEDVKSIVSETELASAILKTLAVIAYKSPVMQSDIIDMRGQGAYDHIKELVKEKFVTKEKEGRSYLLKITEKFYDYFDVEGDEEIREVFERLREETARQKLEVVDIEEDHDKRKESQQQLDKIQIVESDENEQEENPEEVQRKEEEETKRKEEELRAHKEQEQEFLHDIEKRISQVSERVKGEELPNANKKEEEQEETQQKEKQTGTEEQAPEKAEEEKLPEQEEEKKEPEDEQQPLEQIEEFVDKQQEQEKDRPHYL